MYFIDDDIALLTVIRTHVMHYATDS